MFNNFFKIITRNLLRYKGYTLVNMVGLGIGFAAMVWGYQTYRFSFSFDDFHPDTENVYRALTNKEGAEGIKGIFPRAAVNAAKNEFAGISGTARLDSRTINIKSVKGETFTEQVHFTDTNFFSFFNFPLQSGTNNLDDAAGILITEKAAKKYFGNQNAIGETLILYSGEPYALPLTVKGVLKNVPGNSTIHFDFLTGFNNELKPDGTKIADDDWSWFLNAAYFKIPDPRDVPSITQAMRKYLPLQKSAREDWKASGFELVTLREHALQNGKIGSNSLFQRPDDAAAYGPFAFACLLLLSACLNFSNTTVARANTRLKEIGIRKVMGSTYRQLMLQLLMESAIVVLAAIGLSVMLNSWWLPVFNEMFVFVDVHADYLHDFNLLMFLTILLVVVTFLAGAYPAFYISRYNPSIIFRGNLKFGGSNLFSRIMLGLQISISIITVIAGFAFARNAEFQRSYDFGYELRNTIGVFVGDQSTFDVLRSEMKKVPRVTAVAGTRHHIGFGYRNVVAEAEGTKKETNYLEVGSDYLDVMKLKLVAGRGFNTMMQSDYSKSILVTEKLAALYGWKDREALNKQIHIDTLSYSVVGVLKDFQSNNLFEPLEPVVMKLVKETSFQYLVVQAEPTDLNEVFSTAKSTWQKLFPLRPFNGFYQDEITAESYKVSRSIAIIFSWVALVSIVLTATGLFALVSLTMLKRMKEIGLRRVVGATPSNIMLMVNKGYLWIFLLAAFAGCLAGWVSSGILMDTIFKIHAGVEVSTLIVSVLVLFGIAVCTTGIKVWQAIKINPVKLLKTE